MTGPPSFDADLTLGAQIEARARHPELADRVFLRQHARAWTWARYRDECVRLAHFLLHRLGPVDGARPGHVAMLLENHLELLALYGACGYAGLTLFGVNVGLRGDTLAGVIDQSRARVLVVDQRFGGEIARVRRALTHVPPENILVVPTDPARPLDGHDLTACVARETGGALEPPAVAVSPSTPLMVIYTSGTTGLPKGIVNDHVKMLGIGMAVAANLGLGPDDVGYACMPLFHSNSLYLGFHPALHACGALGVRERFSASSFVPDVFAYGATFWNYVGEPVHYILAAIEREYGGDEERILAAVAGDPRNRLRWALGNGAAAPDIERFMRWFGLEDMFELYGSTEAAISTFRRRGDPRGSVGEITDPAVQIRNERGQECAPARLAPDGKLTNYPDAVGEICRVAPDPGLFQGYFDDPEANRAKYRDGVYHSGDLGHVVVVDGRRFLFFDGRTDDWIRKDGENFSALQVARLLQEHPDVVLAAAYGVPCPVSDEFVMAALKLRAGTAFDPRGFFEFCTRQVREGGMDPKWFPDFIRLVEEFDYTQTEKILVRELKRAHFDRRRLPDAAIYWRTRGDSCYRAFTREDWERLRGEFQASERADLLDR